MRRMRGWARHLRVAAAMVTIIAGIPGTLAMIGFVIDTFKVDAPPQPQPNLDPQPDSNLKKKKGRSIGPGRCPTYHVFRDGRCRDVR